MIHDIGIVLRLFLRGIMDGLIATWNGRRQSPSDAPGYVPKLNVSSRATTQTPRFLPLTIPRKMENGTDTISSSTDRPLVWFGARMKTSQVQICPLEFAGSSWYTAACHVHSAPRCGPYGVSFSKRTIHRSALSPGLRLIRSVGRGRDRGRCERSRMRCAREDEDDGGGGGDEEGLRVAGRGRKQRQRGMRGEERRG